MSQHLKISPRDKRKIDHLYLKGFKVADICAELRHLNLTTRQVSQFLYKRGLTKHRAAIEENKQRTALEILEKVRKEGAEDFEAAIEDHATGLKIDAKRLRDGWPLVQDAAGASSLMRAKSLHLNRAFQLFGIEKDSDSSKPAANTLSMFVFRVGDMDIAKPSDAKLVEPLDPNLSKPKLIPPTAAP